MPGATKTTAKADSLSYEEALKKLESIVETMETGDLPLEKLLAQYEDGMKMGKICQSQLADAELKIQQLEQSATGGLEVKPLGRSGSNDDED